MISRVHLPLPPPFGAMSTSEDRHEFPEEGEGFPGRIKLSFKLKPSPFILEMKDRFENVSEHEDGDCRMIPDYSASGVMNGQQMNQDGLILPRKPHNPCMDSMERQNLHRELLLNQKIGKSVLNQKSELQRALEKHKESQSKKELEQQRLECRTPFERIIEERAKRLETLEKQTVIEPPASNKPEFLRVHAKLRAKMDSK